MAVAVLERDLKTLEKTEEEIKVNNGYNTQMSADEQHNAQISEIYARLISSTSNVDEVLGRSQQKATPMPRNELFAKPYLVENARADAEIFRADSPVNRKVMDMQPVMVAEDSEEESEDLRPTSTTIQYKTYGVNKTVEEGKIKNTDAEKRAGLSKKEKIIIATIVSVIIAMFVLIIVNSAIISGINADLGSLQSSLEVVKGSYAGISDEVAKTLENADKMATDFALSLGMINIAN
ncbi:MAG: hypothetical protein K2O89_02880 [Clostridia bacterium]|nr:hypothetical protein [Clostridia bacterium]